ncbi:MAG: hypothetical protein JWP01_2882 [Myxococcales bacterium]|nr:hypothetical protein [Myxococcales bacterium]
MIQYGLLAAVTGVLALGCGSSKAPATTGAGPGSATPLTGELPDTCTASEDCELVQACCGCNAGGKQIAIRKDAVAAFEGSREQRCSETMCAEMISTDPSCSAEAICGQNGRCEVAPHMQHQ